MMRDITNSFRISKLLCKSLVWFGLVWSSVITSGAIQKGVPARVCAHYFRLVKISQLSDTSVHCDSECFVTFDVTMRKVARVKVLEANLCLE